jgi:hypothetical protein
MLNDNVVVIDNDSTCLSSFLFHKVHMSGNFSEEQLTRAGNEPVYVPLQDVTVVGFDNAPESAFYWPPSTTVYQKLVNVGRVAVQNLHPMIEARRLQKGTIEPELIVRASSL